MRCVWRTQLPTELVRFPIGPARFEHPVYRSRKIGGAKVDHHWVQWRKDVYQCDEVRGKIAWRRAHHEKVRQVTVKELAVHDGKDAVAQALLYVPRPLFPHSTRKHFGVDFCPRLEEVRENGRQGLTAMYADYRALTDALFVALDCPKLAIDTSHGEWPQYYEQTREVLEKLDVRV
jgi:hypothetical protein